MVKTEPISFPLETSPDGLVLRGQRFFAGKGRGTRILITSALHGDEPTSTAALWYLAELLGRESFEGSVTLLPNVNLAGVRLSSRLIPLEETDVNRSFPGRSDGCLSERLAARLVELLAEHDALIDVHTAGWCVPFVLLDVIRDAGLRGGVANWAKTSGLPVIGEMAPALAELQALDRSWSACAISQDKPALTLELTGFHTLDSECAKLGGKVLMELVKNASSVSRKPRESFTLPHRLEIYSNHGGLFEAFCKPGAQLKDGETIGVVRSLDGKILENIASKQAGFLLALQPISAVHVGSFLATMAVQVNPATSAP
jgi:predicted deacylase